MSEATQPAAELFMLLTDHRYENVTPYEDLWSTNSNESVLDRLQALCKYFQIDMGKMAAFIKTQTACDYCGERTGDVAQVDGEDICKKCLEETS